ncbi:MAG TPA: thermonuclease family protein [Xanthobacteraceae bacterium]|nr:thermonuclease family protein [Xanthobacteraceae bacterium]
MLALIAGLGGVSSAAAQEPQPAAIPCGGETIAHGSASRVIDGRTLVLDDGREVRLAAIEVPPLAQEADAAPGGTAAKQTLAEIVASAEIVLKRAEVPSDRYGRVLAFAFVRSDGVERSVQADLIAAGFARVAGRVGARACAAELLGLEHAARRAKLGLWADSYYEPLSADNPAEVLASRGRFALVEGKVVSVRESGATIFVNFGRRWTEDFTVTILKRNGRNFAAGGLEPKQLAGRRVRVRGWIEERGGPWIEATRPEQIELTDRE